MMIPWHQEHERLRHAFRLEREPAHDEAAEEERDDERR